MSRRNSRDGKASRRDQRGQQRLEPPPQLQELARGSACPDCSSEVVLLHRRGGDDWDWSCQVRHDDQCPQLAWRQRTGTGQSLALIGKDGAPVPPELAERALELMAEHGMLPARITASTDGTAPPAPSWSEREHIERAVSQMRGDA